MRRGVRFLLLAGLPWLLTLAFAGAALSRQGEAAPVWEGAAAGAAGDGAGDVALHISRQPAAGPGDAALCRISRQAAALTGSLALVGPEERPQRAAEAARAVRALSAQAAGVEDGSRLARVLEGLAGGLERYASGDPAGVWTVQDASAANASLRRSYCRTPYPLFPCLLTYSK